MEHAPYQIYVHPPQAQCHIPPQAQHWRQASNPSNSTRQIPWPRYTASFTANQSSYNYGEIQNPLNHLRQVFGGQPMAQQGPNEHQSGKGQHRVSSFLPSSGLYPNHSFAHNPKALHTGTQAPADLLACPISHITHAACFLTATTVCLGPASSLNGMTAEVRNARIGFLSTTISNKTSGPSLNTHHRAFAVH